MPGLPLNSPFPRTGGRLRRLFDVRHADARTVVGWVEDDFHHFGVTLSHDGERVTDIQMEAVRFPWATCPGARVPLRALIGAPLVKRATDIGAHINMRAQCTHVFDLTGIAVALAANRWPDRHYELLVPDREIAEVEGRKRYVGETRPELYLNGELVMWWVIDGQEILAPDPYAGHSLARGFREWTERMDVEEGEYANIIRRGLLVAGGRSMDHDLRPGAWSEGQPALCHSFQPHHQDMGRRIAGNVTDYAASGAGMLSQARRVPLKAADNSDT